MVENLLHKNSQSGENRKASEGSSLLHIHPDSIHL